MKIGIITLTGADNYGNVLQNYALQEYLRELGCEVETINNSTKYGLYLPERNQNRKFTPSYAFKVIKSRLNYKYNIKNTGSSYLRIVAYYQKNRTIIQVAKDKRKLAFKAFRDKYILGSALDININYEWDKNIIDEYDFFISGSDQVWNPTYLSTSAINFLQFAPKEKRITYAPSFGVSTIPESLKERYAEWLKNIPFLSVREQQGKSIIQELCGREAKVVCDPTMLLSAERWMEVEEKPLVFPNKPYILTYFLGDRTKEYDAYISRIKDQYNLDQIDLWDIFDLDGYPISPQEFIYLIHHAKLVCTDSFHGTVFSILMHTDFVTFPRVEMGNSMGSRIQTLLSLFALENRQYKKIDNGLVFQTDFTNTERILGECRLDAKNFLTHALQSKNTSSVVDNIFDLKRKCCGCTACEQACPKGCIRMQSDSEGFLYPVIDNSQCIHCNRCKKVCPVINDTLNEKNPLSAHISFSCDSQTRKASSSGGVFTELAKNVMNEGGVVFGAGLSDTFEVVHIGINSISDISKLRGSKYVQSNMGDTFRQVKIALESGRKVYFSGTPCQVAGLLRYLDKTDTSNLITQDIICHGVPSPLVWKKNIEQYDGVKEVQFRNKRYGWHYFSMNIRSSLGNYIKRLDEDFFMRLFLDNTILRPSCYDCPLKKSGSYADITLADCWNPRSISNNVTDTDEGLSLVLVNTDKGKGIFDTIDGKRLFRLSVDVQEAIKSQTALKESAPCNMKRAMFFEAINIDRFVDIKRNWYSDNAVKVFKRKYVFFKTKLRFFLTRLGFAGNTKIGGK